MISNAIDRSLSVILFQSPNNLTNMATMRSCIHIEAQAGPGVKLIAAAIKVRVSSKDTASNVEEQVRSGLGVHPRDVCTYESDGCMVGLHGVVECIQQWIRDGDKEAQMEYAHTMENDMAVVRLRARVSSQASTQEEKSSQLLVSDSSSEKKRKFAGWKTHALEVIAFLPLT